LNVLGQRGGRPARSFREKRVAQPDAFVADQEIRSGLTGVTVVWGGTLDQAFDDLFALSTKRTLAVTSIFILP
jgi:hypothetical protein